MKLTLNSPPVYFITTWLAIWIGGTLISYRVYDIAGALWFEGIKALPLGLLTWWLLEKFVLRHRLSKSFSTKNRAIALAVILYWPCLQIIIALSYGLL